MKKIFIVTVFLTILTMASSVFAATPTMEIVENNVCRIDLESSAYFEKKIVASDLPNNQVTLQLEVTNNAETIIPSGELMLVIDSSDSMDTQVGQTTRKDIVLKSANSLVTKLLESNSTSLKIGVVTFSTGTEKQPNTDILVTGTAGDAQKVSDLTNNVSELTSKISAIDGTGPYTNLDSGLQLAKKSFTSENNNKYIIVLTDGLPNLAVGYNDLVSYEGLKNVITQTKSTLQSLSEYKVITMLTGIENEAANFRVEGDKTYTYGQVINEVFGSEEKPTVGKFYNINDSEIEETITVDIYYDLLPISKSLKDITVIDYFPQYIVDNFEFSYVKGIDVSNISANIDTATNSIRWKIEELPAGQTAVIKYNLKLKDNYDTKIIGEILDTNQNIEISYKNYEGTTMEKTSDVTPKIRLTQVDTTVAPTELPKAGSHYIIGGFIALAVLSVIFGYKLKKMNNIMK